MEFTVSAPNATETRWFNDERLQSATTRILLLGESIKKNWFEIAALVAHIDRLECYKNDGFNNVHEWVNKAFGIKKTASYSLLAIGKEYVSEIRNATGERVLGWGTNLVAHTPNPDRDPDFSKTQVEKMLPLGHDKAVELVYNGTITPYMTAREIAKVVKEYTEESTDSDGDGDGDGVDEAEPPEDPTVPVWDKSGMIYNVPLSVLQNYIFGPDPTKIPTHLEYDAPTEEEIEEMEQLAAEYMEQMSIE